MSVGIRSIALLTPGNFEDDSPVGGLEDTLDLFELGERLGYDGAWIRQRHLEHGVGSAAVFLAAASQRTSRIELGTAVIPIGYESPFRLAEDLSLADVLSHGRLQIGVSAGVPPHADLIGDLVFDGDWRGYDLSYGRVERLVSNLRGDFLGDADTVIHSPGNVQRPRLQPYSRGLDERVWYGGSSYKSISWTASAGLNLLLGNLTSAEDSDDYHDAQLKQIALFRREFRGDRTPRIAAGRVVLPTDNAGPAARERYRAFEASRHERTLKPQQFAGRSINFSKDLVGPAADLVEILNSDPVLAEVDELRFELPYEFGRGDYEQIVSDLAGLVAPALGWQAALVS
ncbi:LLM class flavin-dependent oxidoreductase [Frondihabitans cladoniiphilus]|uniref:LLM class flavin-dependent oxidoreductase n=1 Tax=Frondihabitans cladoniiphilus TaxID=715785 RepID=A0ABP8VUM5_9MICO